MRQRVGLTPEAVSWSIADHYLRLVPDPIVIVEYDPAWPVEFERLRTHVAAAVGDVAVAIEHVGSTAVPGLAAKAVIDMVVVVEPHDLQTAVKRLVAIGYVHQGNLGVDGREAFRSPEVERWHHLYVSPTDSEELRAQLTFRERLRANPELAAKYEGLKQELAMRFRDDREGYIDGKTDFVIAASRP
jgi:GrpB-like predicted nucleotidyltransferase (UPF0157 family)